jgi:hypothetical protein
MWNSLANDPGSAVMAIFFIMLFLSIMSIGVIPAWRKHAADKMDHELKLEMVARGMSADEIERVLKAKSATKADLDETLPHPKR